MPHYTYIIQSSVDRSYYIGSTHDLSLRLQRHNDGWTKSTKAKRPWIIVYFKEFLNKSDALKHELEIKRMKSRSYIERLVIDAGGRPDSTNREVSPVPLNKVKRDRPTIAHCVLHWGKPASKTYRVSVYC